MDQKQIDAMFGQLGEILDRVVRLESRMVNVMKHIGLDPHTGKPVANQKK
jgi:hypothetical protein